MNTMRALVDPRLYVPSRRPAPLGPLVPRVGAVRAWLGRVLASMPRRQPPSVALPLTLVLWSPSIEGIASSRRDGMTDT